LLAINISRHGADLPHESQPVILCPFRFDFPIPHLKNRDAVSTMGSISNDRHFGYQPSSDLIKSCRMTG
jgi:hypothetical protein